MGKQYDQNGDVILSEDQIEICRLADFLYEAVDRLFVLEDEKDDFDLHTAVQVYQDTRQKIEDILKGD